MTRDEAVAEIQRGLGFRTDLVDEIIEALIEAQEGLELGTTLPRWLIQEDQTLSITTGDSAQDLPDFFIRVVDQEGPHYNTTDGEPIFLTKKPFGEARFYYGNVEPGKPVAYSIRKDTIYVWPEPDADYDLLWSFYEKDDPLSANVENGWLTNVPYLLIGKAGAQIAQDVNNPGALKKFVAMFVEWNQKKVNDDAAYEQQDQPFVMGRNN